MFYTYLWLREDGTPYYVGKGSGDRAYNQNGHRMRKPLDDSRIMVHEFESEDDAFFAEMFLISFYGRSDNGTGCLSNLTDGGENPPSWKGRKRSEENIRKSAEARTGLKRTEEQKRRISEAHKGQVSWMKGKHHSEISNQKNREAHLGKTHVGIKHPFCKKGHDLNVTSYVNPNTGNRTCRVCKTEWQLNNNAHRRDKYRQKVLAVKSSKEETNTETSIRT
jgi:hypothetical protein